MQVDWYWVQEANTAANRQEKVRQILMDSIQYYKLAFVNVIYSDKTSRQPVILLAENQHRRYKIEYGRSAEYNCSHI